VVARGFILNPGIKRIPEMPGWDIELNLLLLTEDIEYILVLLQEDIKYILELF
jgi:hypothetical protein